MSSSSGSEMARRSVAGVEYAVSQSMVRRASPLAWPVKLVLAAFGVAVGVPAFAVFAPLWLLIMSNKARSQKMASIFIPRLMKQMDASFKRVKEELLKDVVKGRVLDVGCGGGGWLPYFDHKRELECITELEPNQSLAPVIQREVDAFYARNPGHACRVEVVSRFVHELPAVHDDALKYDHVIFGNVMCEVPDQAQFLRDIDLVVKPGGKVIFLEHIRRPSGTWLAWLQDWFNPFWVRASDGCNCNRDTLRTLQQHAGFAQVEAWTLENDGPPFVNLAVAGVCVAAGKKEQAKM